MSVNPTHLPVRKDTETIRKTVLTNIIKMLNNRKWITNDNVEKRIKEISDSYNDDQIYKIKLDIALSKLDTYDPPDDDTPKKQEKDFDDNIVMVKLWPQKVTSIAKSPIILEFLTNYKKNHKILIVDSISDKSKHQLVTTKYTEVFNEAFMMLDILGHVCSPQYEVLNPTDSNELLKSYHLTRKQMKRMYDSDPVSLYLFLKRKQIVRIIRNSELTGKSVDYRIVIHKGN